MAVTRADELLVAIAGCRVLVVGEAMLDRYVAGETTRLCREAPVPIVAVTGERDVPGAAANTAANAAALGAEVSLLSAVGDDQDGASVVAALDACGVRTQRVLPVPGRATLSRTRVVSGGQVLVRCDRGATSDVPADVEAELVRALARAARRADAIVVSDYGYGILTPALLAALEGLHGSARPVLVVDAKHPARYAAIGPDVLKLSFDAAAPLLAGVDGLAGGDRARAVAAAGPALVERLGAGAVAVTLDADGVVLLRRGRAPHRIGARAVPAPQTAGAGDTFTAAIAVALAAGAGMVEAADLAAAAAAVTVERDGTSRCSADDLRRRVGRAAAHGGLDDLVRQLDGVRGRGGRVVFTNGCFDILHPGHVTYLQKARALGDVLVVGLNTDASVRRLKGPGRPVNTLDDRAAVLSALACVDHVVPFGDDTPVALVAALRPDVYCKGGDYARDELPEAEVVERAGGEVVILPFLGRHSTTRTLERVRGGA